MARLGIIVLWSVVWLAGTGLGPWNWFGGSLWTLFCLAAMFAPLPVRTGRQSRHGGQAEGSAPSHATRDPGR